MLALEVWNLTSDSVGSVDVSEQRRDMIENSTWASTEGEWISLGRTQWNI